MRPPLHCRCGSTISRTLVSFNDGRCPYCANRLRPALGLILPDGGSKPEPEPEPGNGGERDVQ